MDARCSIVATTYCRNKEPQQDTGKNTDRQVDEEDPAPTPVVGDNTAGGRADDSGQTVGCREPP